MQFKKIEFPKVLASNYIPSDIDLALPKSSKLPLNQQHYLVYIPWLQKYLKLFPPEFRDFFTYILPYLKVRTTNVHTAVSLSYLDKLLKKFKPVNRRVVAIALCLHDSGWSQLTETEIADTLGVRRLKPTGAAKNPKLKHAVKSEEIARKILVEYQFKPRLTAEEVDLVCKAVLYHDKPDDIKNFKQEIPLEVLLVADLDHFWSFTHENFWQDTLRKQVSPIKYLKSIKNDLDSYFVTSEGKKIARGLANDRAEEIKGLEQNILLDIVGTWKISKNPEYRGFRCANCQKYNNVAWYHWLNDGGFKLPVHLCKNCEAKFQDNAIGIDESKKQIINRKTFGNSYKYSPAAIKKFKKIVVSWPKHQKVEFKAFSCDQCGKVLDIDKKDGLRKGYHCWWKMEDGKTLAELHFHKSCAELLGIKQ